MWKTDVLHRKSPGFTLVELLIVISVLAVLAVATSVTAIVPNLQRARDTDRKADLEGIRSGLEIYRSNSANKDYPNTSFSGLSAAIGAYATVNNDPKSGQTYFYSRPNPTTYVLCARMEDASNQTGNSGCTGSSACGTSMACNYSLANP